MLQQLHNQRHSTGRRVSAVVLFAWLTLIFQTCAMAASAPATPCEGMTMQATEMGDHGAHSDMGDEDCCPPAVCASLDHGDTIAIASADAPRVDSSVAATVLHEPVQIPDRTQTFQTRPYHSAVYLPPHPTIRFCVLRI